MKRLVLMVLVWTIISGAMWLAIVWLLKKLAELEAHVSGLDLLGEDRRPSPGVPKVEASGLRGRTTRPADRLALPRRQAG